MAGGGGKVRLQEVRPPVKLPVPGVGLAAPVDLVPAKMRGTRWMVSECRWLVLALCFGHAATQSAWDISQVKSQLVTTLATMTSLVTQLETNYQCFMNTSAAGCPSLGNATNGVGSLAGMAHRSLPRDNPRVWLHASRACRAPPLLCDLSAPRLEGGAMKLPLWTHWNDTTAIPVRVPPHTLQTLENSTMAQKGTARFWTPAAMSCRPLGIPFATAGLPGTHRAASAGARRWWMPLW